MSDAETRERALESLDELIWSGVPRGEDSTCGTCGGLWPHHDPEDCFIGEARAILAASVERERQLEARLGWTEYVCGHGHRWSAEDKSRRCPVCGTITFEGASRPGSVANTETP